MPAHVFVEDVGGQLVAATVSDAGVGVDADFHAVSQVSGRYWTSRIPGLKRGVLPGSIR